jgi:hypothetical protein
MPPRGNRLACTLKSVDGAQGSFDVHPGEQPSSVSKIDPVKWNKETDKPVLEGAWGKSPFKVIEDAQKMLKRGK